jgi:hypothetical protein
MAENDLSTGCLKFVPVVSALNDPTVLSVKIDVCKARLGLVA